MTRKPESGVTNLSTSRPVGAHFTLLIIIYNDCSTTRVAQNSDSWILLFRKCASCITFALTSIGLRRWAVNPTIDQLPDRAVLTFSDMSMFLVRFLFWTISRICMFVGD